MIPFLLAVLALASPQDRQETQDPAAGRRAGASLLLPEFDPAPHFDALEKGMSKLDPVTDTLKQANEELQPLIEEFKIDPSLENQAALENALAGFTAGLARKIRGALVEREKVAFAFQDVIHGVSGMKTSLVLYSESLHDQVGSEEELLHETVQKMEDAAVAWDNAEDPEEKKARMEEFKILHRQKERYSYRARYLGSLAGHYASLAEGVSQLGGSLRTVQGRVRDAYDRLDDAGEMLAFAAGYRRDATGLVARYQSFFGDGDASVRQVLERIQSIQGRLEIFEGATKVLDEAGPLMPMISDMDELTRGLRGKVETAGAEVVLSEDDYWSDEIQKTLKRE
ncbi:MAG: hypothetical protein H8E31_07760 [Planctomycetes bacterium]|nr:hypothetical protein [Planctomycetota bacterium]